MVVVLSESDERVEGNPVWQNKFHFFPALVVLTYTAYHPLGGRYLVCFGPSQRAWSKTTKTHKTSTSEQMINGVCTMPTWVLDISAVAADGRRPRRVEEKATNSESGNRQT